LLLGAGAAPLALAATAGAAWAVLAEAVLAALALPAIARLPRIGVPAGDDPAPVRLPPGWGMLKTIWRERRPGRPGMPLRFTPPQTPSPYAAPAPVPKAGSGASG